MKKRIIISLVIVGVLTAMCLTLFLSWPMSGKLLTAARDFEQQIKSGKHIGKTDLDRVFGQPYDRKFSGWDFVYLIDEHTPYSGVDDMWIGIKTDSNSNLILDAKVFSD